MRRLGVLVLVIGGMCLSGCRIWEPPVLPPTDAPRELSASLGAAADSIAISWQAVERAATYNVFRRDPKTDKYKLVGSTTSTRYTDRVEEQGKWYWYKVQACNPAGCGPHSEEIQGYAGRPPAPTWISASNGDHPEKIVIKWEEIPGVTEYQVFRDRIFRCPGLCHRDTVRTNYYEDKEVRPGLRYRYAVRACNRFGCSRLSPEDTGCLPPCPLPFSLDEE